jgi:cobalamin biosynthesis protein CobC
MVERAGVGSMNEPPAADPKPIAHGGRLNEARRMFPGAPEPFLDLSTGINPLAYPLPIFTPDCFTRLPEPEAEASLLSAAAAAYGANDPSLLAAAPGTQILIDLLPRLWPADRVAVLGPTYAEHAHAWTKVGASVATVADIAKLEGARVAVVCNPNNPDGRRIAPNRLLALADRLHAAGGLVVVDEAFADLEDDGLSLAWALPHPAVIVLRSFGKTYGLAGVRLGFALAAPARAMRIRDALGPWAVSGPAIAVGCTALSDRSWLDATKARLERDRSRLDALLSLAALRVIGGTLLFRLGESPSAAAIFQHLGRAGILVRRFAARPAWLRVGLPGAPEAWQRLEAALTSSRTPPPLH